MASKQGPVVLIVDDNADGADSLGLLLEMLGAKVRVVYSGQAALAALEAFQPAVVLLDVGMPELDGYEVARRIRATQDGRYLYLVAVTGYGQPKDRDQALAAGFDDYLVKPFDRDRLATLLAAARRA